MNKDFFKSKRILITGGTGLIGRQLLDILSEYDAKLISVSLDNLKFNDNVEYINADLTNFETCKNITKNIDYVFHLAGIKGSASITLKKPSSFFVPLIMMNTNLLEACRLNNVKRILYTSSIGAYSPSEIFIEGNDYDDPMDHYPGWAKRMAEKQIQSYKIEFGLKNFSVIRPSNVYGPGDNFDEKNAMVIPSLIKKIYTSKNKKITVFGDGTAIRDFIYSKDVAMGCLQTLYYQPNLNYVNIGSGKEITIRELVETLNSFIDFDYNFDTEETSGYSKRVMDINLAKNNINFEPRTSLHDGLKTTWEWYLKNQDEYLKRKNYLV